MLLSPLLLSCLPSLAIAAPSDAQLFQLVRREGVLSLESVGIDEGQTRVIRAGGGSEVVTVLLPPASPGMSGELLRAGEDRGFVARLNEGELVLSIADGDGEGRELARVDVHELKRSDVRVSAVDDQGAYRSWHLRDWSQIVPDPIGPGIDLFGGLLPLGSGDLVLTTETTRQPSSSVAGRTPLFEAGDHVAVSARAADGSEGCFLVDTSAGSTVVARDFLAEDAVIERSTMVERSARGVRTLDTQVTGATGTVGGILGQSALAELRLGEVRFEDVTVRVIDELPSFGGKRLLGILGLDLLRRGEHISMRWPQGDVAGELALGSPSRLAGETKMTLPLSVAAGLPFVRGVLAGNEMCFSVDSGSRYVFVTTKSASRIDLELDPASAVTIRGLGADRESAPLTVDPELLVGGRAFEDFPVYAADLPVFARVADSCDVGVLGMPFLRSFGTCTLDFESNELRLGD